MGDRYRYRANKLVQKAKELETITGCTVTSFEVIAPPGKDYKQSYGHRSANGAAQYVNRNQENPQPAPSQITSPPLSNPQKNLAGQRNKQTTYSTFSPTVLILARFYALCEIGSFEKS